MSEFDNFYWKHNDCLNKDTSLAHSFGEKVWNHQQAKIDDSENTRAVLYRENMDIREKNTDLQAKIDILEVQLKGAEERAKLILDHKNKMVDELQARVDRVVHILTYTNHASTPLCNELRDILKGNKDEK